MAQFEPSDPTEPVDLARYREGGRENYIGIGASLRESRRETGQELRAVAAALRIRRLHLEAIEEGRFDDLPGQAYALGFVRTYADYLNLDSDWVVDRFREELAPGEDSPDLNFPEASAPRSRPTAGLLGAAVVLGAAAFGSWYHFQDRGEAPSEIVAEVPEHMLGETALPATADDAVPTSPPPAAGDAAPAAGPAADAPAAEEPAPGAVAAGRDAVGPEPPVAAEPEAAAAEPETGEAAPAPDDAAVASGGGISVAMLPPAAGGNEDRVVLLPPAPAAGPANAPPEVPVGDPAAPEPDAAVGPADPPTAQWPVFAGLPPASEPVAAAPPRAGESRVVLRAARETWVRVQGPDNETVLTRNLQPGDVYMVPGGSGFVLTTGNAGGLEILVDGVLLPPLGAEGAVRRNISLDADALTGGAP